MEKIGQNGFNLKPDSSIIPLLTIVSKASSTPDLTNDSGTFGYKINARYSENGEFEIDETTALQTGGQLLEKAEGYNVDATLYFRPSSDFEVTAQAGISARRGVSWSEFFAETLEDNENNFFRKGEINQWRNALDTKIRNSIEKVCEKEMIELGCL